MELGTSHKWTLEELDLDQGLVPLISLLKDKQQLVESLFSILSTREIRELLPHNIKDIPLDILKDICIIELKDNRLVDDQTISAVLQPERPPSPDRSAETTVEAVSSTNELPDKAGNEPLPKSGVQTEGTGEQVVESTEDQDSQAEDVFEVVDRKIRESLYQKHKLPLEDLDLSKPVVPLINMLDDRPALLRLLFSILTTEEVNHLKPEGLQMEGDELRVKSLAALEQMSVREMGEVVDQSTAVGMRSAGKGSDERQETAADESGERKGGKKSWSHNEDAEDGAKGGADAVEIKDPAMDEDRKEKKRMDRQPDRHKKRRSGAQEVPAAAAAAAAGMDRLRRAEKDHPSNEKSNERWMNFCPEETLHEIQQLEDRARTLRRMLTRLEQNSDPLPVNRPHRRTRHRRQASPPLLAQEPDVDLIVCGLREEDEDSLDRELKGPDQ